MGQLVTDVPSGFSLTPPHETKKDLRNDIHVILELAWLKKNEKDVIR
jgi:hypothetical protein